MNNITTFLLIFIFLIIMTLIIIFLAKYNHLIKLTIDIEKKLDELIYLQKERWNILPDFINTIRSSTNYIPKHLEELIKLKNNLYNNKSEKEKIKLNENLDSVLPDIISELEKIKELNYEGNYQNISKKILKLEGHIQTIKSDYNKKVLSFKKLIKKFPNNYIIKLSKLNIPKTLS